MSRTFKSNLCAFLAMLLAFMPALSCAAGNITYTNTFSAGQVIKAADINQNFTDAKTVVNGSIDNSNISATAAIVPTKLDTTKEIFQLRATGNRCISGGITADTVPRCTITSDGLLQYGPGSGTAVDMGLARTNSTTLAVRDAANANDRDLTCRTLTASGAVNGTNTNASENCRLTLTTAVPVTNADVTAATTVYLTPYLGNTVSFANSGGTAWTSQTFSEVSLTVPATTSQMYDVFAQSASSTTVTITALAWTNDTTRATALSLLNGRQVKTGDNTSLWVGSFRTTAVSGQTEDSAARRLIFNAYNRVPRRLSCSDATSSWTYTTATWRAADNSTTDGTGRVAFITGVVETPAYMMSVASESNTSAVTAETGINLDSTSATPTVILQIIPAANSIGAMSTFFQAYPAIGYHYLQRMEFSVATGTTTWYGGGNSGAEGWVMQ